MKNGGQIVLNYVRAYSEKRGLNYELLAIFNRVLRETNVAERRAASDEDLAIVTKFIDGRSARFVLLTIERLFSYDCYSTNPFAVIGDAIAAWKPAIMEAK